MRLRWRRRPEPLSSVRLLTPVPWPNKVVAYPVNYHAHGVEMGSSYRANNQGFFLKPPSSLSGPADPIVLPVNAGRRIDHECELALIVAKEGRDIPREKWREYTFGYSNLIDAVIRGKEERVTRKGFDTFCPVGPWIVTADELHRNWPEARYVVVPDAGHSAWEPGICRELVRATEWFKSMR